MLHEPDRAELQLSWCQGTRPVGHKAPNYLVYISSLSPALQSLYLKSIHTVLPFHISTTDIAEAWVISDDACVKLSDQRQCESERNKFKDAKASGK